jgi:hypothetical protein
MAKKVVTLGEIMLRLSTPDYKRFVQADSFDVTYGGGEANVSAALCNYGLQGVFVSKVPENAYYSQLAHTCFYIIYFINNVGNHTPNLHIHFSGNFYFLKLRIRRNQPAFKIIFLKKFHREFSI